MYSYGLLGESRFLPDRPASIFGQIMVLLAETIEIKGISVCLHITEGYHWYKNIKGYSLRLFWEKSTNILRKYDFGKTQKFETIFGEKY